MSRIVSSSPSVLRETNLRAILDTMRSNGPMTGTDLISATGLTRATVHGVCDDLIGMGWLVESDAKPTEQARAKGRPARIYEFNAAAGVVLGIDHGYHRVTVLACDLRGNQLARCSALFDETVTTPEARIEIVDRCALDALAEAGVGEGAVLAVGVGVAAPLDSAGGTPPGNEYWALMNIDLSQALAARHGWHVIADNDANLAALAERWRGVCQGAQNFAVILAGERLGTGIVESGRVLHGSHGAAGEMTLLDFVDGVGDALGIAPLAARWGREAMVDADVPGLLAELSGGRPENVTAELVFIAAGRGDAQATVILARLGERFARIIGVIASIVNPECVVICGAVAESSRELITFIEDQLPRFSLVPPRVLASGLGGAVVALGAVRVALDYTEAAALHPALRPIAALPV